MTVMAPGTIPFAVTDICPEAVTAAVDVLQSGWVTTGPGVEAFEQDFAAFVHADHAIAVSSCTAAIEMSLRALNLPAGSAVLTSALTFCGAVGAIVHAGLRPVLVDVNPLTLMPDAVTTAQAVARHGQASAMVVVHYAGQPAPVQELAEAAGLGLSHVVEDAAHALGTWTADKPVGTTSATTCFSFYATKNLPIGEGGMITTNDGDLAARLRPMRLHGMTRDAWRRYLPGGSWRYTVEEEGLKANLTDLQAAIGRAQLKKFPAWQLRRASLADRYTEALSQDPRLITPGIPLSGTHAWHLYVVQIHPRTKIHRDEVIDRLTKAGVGASVHFIPVHHQPFFRRLLGPTGCSGLETTNIVFEQILSLPLHPLLTDAEVDRVCATLLDIVRSAEVTLAPAASPALVKGRL